ncbi:MAG: replication/maintenance protein RepL [Methylococcales bacterium]|nr:replication/maintenance protein RepL [Methylococcales bacterium]
MIRTDTGEKLTARVVTVNSSDKNFQKLWISSILGAVNELSSKRLKLVVYLIEQSSKSRNVIVATVAQIAKETSISVPTVTRTLKVLEQNDIIRRKPGVIWMNPNVVYQGSHLGRLDVLFRYEQVNKEPTLLMKKKMVDKELKFLEKRLRELVEEKALLNTKSPEEEAARKAREKKVDESRDPETGEFRLPPAPY